MRTVIRNLKWNVALRIWWIFFSYFHSNMIIVFMSQNILINFQYFTFSVRLSKNNVIWEIIKQNKNIVALLTQRGRIFSTNKEKLIQVVVERSYSWNKIKPKFLFCYSVDGKFNNRWYSCKRSVDVKNEFAVS